MFSQGHQDGLSVVQDLLWPEHRMGIEWWVQAIKQHLIRVFVDATCYLELKALGYAKTSCWDFVQISELPSRAQQPWRRKGTVRTWCGAIAWRPTKSAGPSQSCSVPMDSTIQLVDVDGYQPRRGTPPSLGPRHSTWQGADPTGTDGHPSPTSTRSMMTASRKGLWRLVFLCCNLFHVKLRALFYDF